MYLGVNNSLVFSGKPEVGYVYQYRQVAYCLYVRFCQKKDLIGHL